MTSFKLILRNVRKNMKDYMIYFLTLMLSVGMFYAFNSIQSQLALSNLSITKKMLSEQLGTLISILSVIIAIILGFLMIYANGFLLKRRKKELGLYTLLGMEKGKISRIFAGETMCVGVVSLVCGLLIGMALSQGLAMLSLRMFAVDMGEFRVILSVSALTKTVCCFTLIFLIVMLFNVRTISKVKLIDLLTANRKNENLGIKNKAIQITLLVVSIMCIAASGLLIHKYGLLPSKEYSWFQVAVVLLAAGTALLFYSASAVILYALQTNRKVYLKGLNSFLSRQVGSKIRTDFLMMTVVSLILMVAICGLTAGISTAMTMNKASKAALPFNLNVISDIDICGEEDMIEYLKTRDVDMDTYAENYMQIGLYYGDFNYEDVFAGQDARLWDVDKAIPECEVMVVTVSDFNKSMAMQGKEGVTLSEDQFLLNCNYKGTFKYIDKFLQDCENIKLGGITLCPASREVMQETYWMTSVGNNDRGTFIVPDKVAERIEKNANVLLVQYTAKTDAAEVLRKMMPIGLDWEKDGYRYTDKSMLEDMYYGTVSLMVFLSAYIGLIFLLICATLLSLKQLIETADNIYRYGVLQKLGADSSVLYKALFKQMGIFFLAPVIPATIYSSFAVKKIVEIVEEFMNLHIEASSWMTVILILIVYGGYFLVTYLSCKRMIQEKKFEKMEM